MPLFIRRKLEVTIRIIQENICDWPGFLLLEPRTGSPTLQQNNKMTELVFRRSNQGLTVQRYNKMSKMTGLVFRRSNPGLTVKRYNKMSKMTGLVFRRSNPGLTVQCYTI
ncbi:hypothetical protein DPMN_175526 [Dreissena polymorpha]|uniref:Uncharacterized protein n=1 Tax=Dreissena polymorpha TaxID=45954 RepID=A0A9D4E9I8_DREPO|nr:hypothetical protein DPMN_175526 [Dreissena polymorpha]